MHNSDWEKPWRMLLIMAFNTIAAWFLCQTKSTLYSSVENGYFALHCGVMNGIIGLMFFFFMSLERMSLLFAGIKASDFKRFAIPILLYAASIGIIFAWLKHPF